MNYLACNGAYILHQTKVAGLFHCYVPLSSGSIGADFHCQGAQKLCEEEAFERSSINIVGKSCFGFCRWLQECQA